MYVGAAAPFLPLTLILNEPIPVNHNLTGRSAGVLASSELFVYHESVDESRRYPIAFLVRATASGLRDASQTAMTVL
jgi:hypothetical protein